MLPLLTQVNTALSTYDAGDSSSDVPPLHCLTVTTTPVSLHLSSHIHFQQLNCATPLLKRTDRPLTGDNLPNHHWKLFLLNTNHSQDPRDAEASGALWSLPHTAYRILHQHAHGARRAGGTWNRGVITQRISGLRLGARKKK